MNESQDADGLRVFYYLVQDLKVSCWSSRDGEDSTADDSVLHLLPDYATLQDQAE